MGNTRIISFFGVGICSLIENDRHMDRGSMEFERKAILDSVQRRVGYHFSDPGLLDTALTHASCVKGEGRARGHNERLEYLGDAVLEFCVSAHIYNTYPELSEGPMTKARALAVCEEALFSVSKMLDLGPALLLSRGEERSGGREKPSILADAVEALIGAIYLDGGMDAANALVMRFAPKLVADAVSGVVMRDYRTMLQEYVQKERLGTLAYVLANASGPDHKKEFEMQVFIAGKVYGTGSGRSKQEAAQRAAQAALEMLTNEQGNAF